MAAVTGFPQSLPLNPQCCAQHICSPGFLRSNVQGQVKKMYALLTHSNALRISNLHRFKADGARLHARPCWKALGRLEAGGCLERSPQRQQGQSQRMLCWMRQGY